MPELPEVETIMLGLKPLLLGKTLKKIMIRQSKLRWPIPSDILIFEEESILEIKRRAKYILIKFSKAWMIIHLGMSGSLKIVPSNTAVSTHDHVDLIFEDFTLRYNDPRRFGAILSSKNPLEHVLLKKLAPEPLEDNFTDDYLFQKVQGKTLPIKSFIMNQHYVVGVGNIYAAESLFLAGIHPLKASKTLTKSAAKKLVAAIQSVLKKAIDEGGTTLKDYVNCEGKPGYFAQSLKVYGRGHQPCFNCKIPLEQLRIGQRATVFCKYCQV